MDGGGGTPRPVLLTGVKKSHLGCLISFELPMGFQKFLVINKIHPLKKSYILYIYILLQVVHHSYCYVTFEIKVVTFEIKVNKVTFEIKVNKIKLGLTPQQ